MKLAQIAKLIVLFAWVFVFGQTRTAEAGIHQLPIVLKGHDIRSASRYPIESYRLFRNDGQGKAIAIPFQIDEINEWGDYVLDRGGPITKNTGNGIFDIQDELAFMGQDVGIARQPSQWPDKAPTLIFEIKYEFPMQNPSGDRIGAVYLGVYFKDAPALSSERYVAYQVDKASVQTSQYRYRFDRKNHLVVEGVDMASSSQNGQISWKPIIDSSTFYMKANLKYFVTLQANHRTVDSSIEAYKVGPIRSIVRVGFFYSFLKLKFELGMYTEVSFFDNSVVLPAIMYNPLDGPKSLNSDSGFYYGFAFSESPQSFMLESNMPDYRQNTFFNWLKFSNKPMSQYWLSLTGKDRMIYVEISPSTDMLRAQAVPFLYTSPLAGKKLRERSNHNPKPLKQAPVNLGLFFDLSKFKEGEHRMSFQLFFENQYKPEHMKSFRSMSSWNMNFKRL